MPETARDSKSQSLDVHSDVSIDNYMLNNNNTYSMCYLFPGGILQRTVGHVLPRRSRLLLARLRDDAQDGRLSEEEQRSGGQYPQRGRDQVICNSCATNKIKRPDPSCFMVTSQRIGEDDGSGRLEFFR